MPLARIEMGGRPPKGAREWGRYFTQLLVIPDNDSVGPAQIEDSAVTTAKVADGNVTLAKIEDLAAGTILGRTGTAGPTEELTADDVVGLLQAESWVFGDTVEYDGSVTYDAAVEFNSTAQFNGQVGFYGTTPIAQPAHITDAVVAHALNAVFSDTEVEAALDALGVKINAIIALLETIGLKASS